MRELLFYLNIEKITFRIGEYMKKIVACIPIKLNSERLPFKNIKKMYDGTPLMVLLQKTLLSINRLDEIYVFCSDEVIQDYIIDGVRFIKRSPALDQNNATPQMIISEFIGKIDADIYAFCHVTSPFVSTNSINQCIDSILSSNFDSAFTAQRMQKLLWLNNSPFNFDASNIPRTQDLPCIFSEVSAAYFFTKELFLQTKRRIGFKPFICELNSIESIDIDTESDFLIADSVYRLIKGDTHEI